GGPMPEAVRYPATRVSDARETLFGVRVDDPYRWLEDGNDAEVQAWMAAQDAFARERLARLPGREALARRLRERFYVGSAGAPRPRGDRLFFTRRRADREKPVLYWKEGEAGEERALLDLNQLPDDRTAGLGSWVPSPDGTRVVYALHPNNADDGVYHLIDV